MKAVFRGLAAVITMAVMGCETLSPKSTEEVVGARAMAQAEALRTGDYDLALSFMTPSYQASPRARDYQRQRAGSGGWQNIELKWVRCDNEEARCEVRLLIYALRPPALTTPYPIPLDDTWIKINGKWYQYE